MEILDNLQPNNFGSSSVSSRFQTASDSLPFMSVKRPEDKIGQLNQEIADFVTDDSPNSTVTELRRTINLQASQVN